MPSTDADAPVIAPRSSFEQNSTLTPGERRDLGQPRHLRRRHPRSGRPRALRRPRAPVVVLALGLVALLLTFSGRRCAFPGRR
jgi:hypothetical protein